MYIDQQDRCLMVSAHIVHCSQAAQPHQASNWWSLYTQILILGSSSGTALLCMTRLISHLGISFAHFKLLRICKLRICKFSCVKYTGMNEFCTMLFLRWRLCGSLDLANSGSSLTETVLELSRYSLEVSHAAGAGGLSSLSFFAPVPW